MIPHLWNPGMFLLCFFLAFMARFSEYFLDFCYIYLVCVLSDHWYTKFLYL